MNLESIGAGVGGSIVSAVLTWMGFKQRLDRADADIEALRKNVVFKDAHQECSRSWHDAMAALERKIDYGNKLLASILERMK